MSTPRIDLGKLYDCDIIVLDSQLPDMSGFEVLKSLRLSKIATAAHLSLKACGVI